MSAADRKEKKTAKSERSRSVGYVPDATDVAACLMANRGVLKLDVEKKYINQLVSTAINRYKNVYVAESADFNEFYRINTNYETYNCMEYHNASDEPFTVHIQKPTASEEHYVYKRYERVDQIVVLERFLERIMNIEMFVGKFFDFETATFHETLDFLGIVSGMRHEFDRKEELLNKRFGNGAPSLKARTQKGRSLPGTYRSSFARILRKSPMQWPHALAIRLPAIRNSFESRMEDLAKLCKDPKERQEMKDKFGKFSANNQAWIKARKEMKVFTGARDIPSKRKDITAYLCNPSSSIYTWNTSDIFNELAPLPSWFTTAFHTAVALKPLSLRIHAGHVVRVREGAGGSRLLRVSHSRYKCPAPAVHILSSPQEPVKRRLHVPPILPPTNATVSGVSTHSALSTATTSPNSWHYNWKTQPIHTDYEHRQYDSLQNPLVERKEAELDTARRFDAEFEHRTNLIRNLQSDLRFKHSDALSLASFHLQLPFDMILKNMQKEAEALLGKASLTAEETVRLRVLLHGMEKRGVEKEQEEEEAVMARVSISSGWRSAACWHMEEPHAARVAKLMSTSHCVKWDCAFSVLDRVSRCDKYITTTYASSHKSAAVRFAVSLLLLVLSIVTPAAFLMIFLL